MLSPTDFAARLGDWQHPATGSLAARLGRAIQHAVEAGLLPAGSTVPPERELATALAVSRPTVNAALRDLRASGVLVSRQGSGTWVADAPAHGHDPASLADAALGGPGLNLAASVPADAIHLGDLSIDVDDLLAVTPGHGYDPLGLAGFRRAIAEHLTRAGLATSPDRVMVSAGGHGGLVDALGAVVGPGDLVLTETYTYPGMIDIVGQLGGSLVAIPTDGAGPDVEALAAALSWQRPRAVVFSPGINNPTGASWAPERLAEVAELLDDGGVTVVDDAVLAELGFAGRTPGLAEACAHAPVVLVESLSKLAWGGLRAGWVRWSDPHLGERITARRTRLDLGPPVPSQLLGARVVERIPTLAAARRAVLVQRARLLANLLADAIPAWRIAPPAGGLSLWVELPMADASAFVAVAHAFGVEVLAGERCRAERGFDSHVRLGFDRPAPQLTEAVSRLARAWSALRR